MPMKTGQLLRDGIQAAKQGRMAEARRLLNRVIEADRRSELGWLWLSAAVDTDEQRIQRLDHVISINPGNEHALRGLAALRAQQRDREPITPEDRIPWYFSPNFQTVTLLFCTPLWAVLTLADKRQSKPTKAFAALLCVVLPCLVAGALLYATRGAQFMTLVGGPGEVRFGSEIHESTAGVSLRGESTHFADGTSGDQVGWIASLGAPARTTKLDIVLSMGTAAGGEVVIVSNPLQLADPSYDTIYGTLSPALYFTTGTYTLRLMSGDSILAQGQFNVP